MNDEDLKELAKQLRCPSGDIGGEVASAMEDTNSAMVNRAIDSMGDLNGLTLMELGPGNGHHLPRVLETCQLIYTVDISELMYDCINTNFASAISEEKLINLLGDINS